MDQGRQKKHSRKRPGLKAQLEAVRLVTDHAPVYLAHVDCTGRYRFVNRGYAERFGLQPQDFIGRTMQEILGEAAYASVQQYLQAALAGERVDFELEVPYARLGPRVMQASYAPQFDAAGEVEGVVAVITDITERKQTERALKRSEALTQQVIESSVDCIKLLDLDGRLLSMNTGGQRLMELKDIKPFLGQLYFDFFQGAEREAARQAVAQAAAGGIGKFQAYCPTCGGKPKWWDEVVTPVCGADGKPEQLLAISRDITEQRRMTEALRQREQYLEAIIAATPECVKIVAPDGSLLEMNSAGLAMVEAQEREEVIGRCIYDVVAPEYREQFRQMNERVCRGEQATLQFEIIGLRGTRRTMETHAVPLAVDDGTWKQLAITRDVTERRRSELELKASEERFRSLSACSPVGVFTTDIGGRCTYTNPRCQAICGFTEEQALGDGWANFVHPDDRAQVFEHWYATARAGEQYAHEIPFVHADGTVRAVFVRTAAMRADDGRLLGHVGTAEDITERKASENALRESARQKDEFLAVLAHELRNPLAPMRTALHLIRQSPNDTQLMDEAHSILNRQLRQMVRLVDDLLDVSRITQGKIELKRERLELGAVIQSAIETSRPVIESAGHELRVTFPPEAIYVEADATRLAQVFSNLLNNAAKYTPRGGMISLAAERQGDVTVVGVRDNGIGIPSDMLESIFEMFTQVDRSLEKTHGGLGIGLTLARKLIEMHGGTIEARSDGPGTGTEFNVRLPCLDAYPVHAASADAQAARAQGGTRRRVLVVDDNRDGADSIALLLQTLGHDAQSAYDGAQALQVAATLRPDVVLLDIGMPKMNGYDVCRALRSEPWAGRMAIIALTGWGQREHLHQSREAGFDHHLVKPVDPAALSRLLDSGDAPPTEGGGPPTH